MFVVGTRPWAMRRSAVSSFGLSSTSRPLSTAPLQLQRLDQESSPIRQAPDHPNCHKSRRGGLVAGRGTDLLEFSFRDQ
jgi:hypothetical protein